MERAERNGAALRRLLRSADRFSDAAIRLGSRDVKTPSSRVSASLCSVTRRDQRPLVRERAAGREEPRLRVRSPALRPRLPRRFDAVALLPAFLVAFFAIAPSIRNELTCR